MKITLFSILSFMFMTLAFMPDSAAEDSPQWHLPAGVIARLGKGAPTDVKYSPDGTRLAVATEIGVWIYDVHTGEELDLLAGSESDVSTIAYSPDGRILAGGSGRKVHLWDVARGQLIFTLTGHESHVLSVAFSPDGKTLASSEIFSTVRLWDMVSRQHKTALVGHTDPVWGVAFSPDGKTLASAGEDTTVRLWDAANGHHKATLVGHTERVQSVAFSPDGKTLASGGLDGARLWDAHTGQHQATIRLNDDDHRNRFYSVSFSPDGQTLAGAGGSREMRLWDVASQQHKFTLIGHLSGIWNIAFSPNGQTLASAGQDGTVRLWDVMNGQHKTTLWHMAGVSSIAFSSDGQTLATSAFKTVHLWDAHTGQHQNIFTLAKDNNWIESVAFSPDGRTLASAGSNGLHLWDAHTGQHQATFTGHRWVVKCVAFSPDGRTLASGGWDTTVRLWDVATTQPKAVLTGHTGWIMDVVFSPDGRTLASAGGWTDDTTVRLWDVATTQSKTVLIGHTSAVSSVAFSPDGRTLASSSWDSIVRLWDVHTGERKASITEFYCGGANIAFTPDGNTLILGDHTGRMLLWDVAKGKLLETLKGHKNKIENMAFSANGRKLASGSEAGTVLLWDLTPFFLKHGQPDTDIQQTEDDTAIQQYEREMVRLIYFRPSDRPHRQGIDTALDTLIRWSQYFFAEQMQDYGRKTFAFETDATGYAKVHHVTGKFTDTYYHGDTYAKVVKEVADQFDTSRDVYLIAVDVSSEFINNEGTCGIGGGSWKSHDSQLWRRDFGGTAVIPASGVCINPSITAHELGHVFGLEHDFRDDAYLMAYGTQERLSHCAAEWLDAHRFFNNDPTAFNETTTIAMQPSQASDPGALRLQFELTDTDGLHQAQLIVPAAATDPAEGTKLHSCKSLNGKNQTVAFLTTDATVPSDSEVTLQVVDAIGNITRQAFSLKEEGITSKGEDITSNRAPVAVGTIPDQNLTVGGTAVMLSISPYFSDPDGDVLSYKAQSNNTRIVGVRLSGTQITIGPRTVGSASVAVTASDGKLLVTQRISVHVRDALVNAGTDGFDDTFEGTALQNPNWQWQNEPANWDVGETRDGFLHIEAETDRNLWASDASHFLYQETSAEAFDVETHFFSRWDTSSGVNGLVVKSPADNNWVTIKFWSQGAAAKGQIQYQTKQNEHGNGLTNNAGFTPTFGNTELFFRLRKQGDTYTGWYKTNEADPWIEIGVTNFPLTPPLHLGIYAGVAARTGTLTVDYAYFRSTVDTGVLASPLLHVAAMEVPTETTLLPNYPNPFNPETWIPYQLSSSSDVTVYIYAVNGRLVRRLPLGRRAAGMYHGRSRAAYWDGKNEIGEPVASGVYFYTLVADNFTATRKMLIRK